MLVNNHIVNIINAWKVTGSKFVFLFTYALIIGLIKSSYDFNLTIFSTTSIAIIGTGVSIFLGFRINSAYGRWWEARMIWGNLISNCRNFGTTLAVFSSNKAQQETKEIIFNLIGFINAIRLHLRQQSPEEWQQQLWHYEINGKKLFTQSEINTLMEKRNKPSQILHLIGVKLGNLMKKAEPRKEYTQVYISQLLLPFYHCLGQCERIKNTVFPWGYAFYTLRFVWLLALLLPLGLLKNFNIVSALECAIAGTMFITAEQVGRNLDEPFNNSFNDTPMTALCKNIEIDLLDQLGEKEIPQPLLPQNGVLF